MQIGRKESYAHMEPIMKKQVLSNKAIWHKSLGPEEKEKLLSKSAIWYKSLDTAQKQKRAEWFNLLSSAQKQKTAEWYKSMNPGEKEKLFLAEQNDIKHWILQTKIRLYHKSKLIRKPKETQFNMI